MPAAALKGQWEPMDVEPAKHKDRFEGNDKVNDEKVVFPGDDMACRKEASRGDLSHGRQKPIVDRAAVHRIFDELTAMAARRSADGHHEGHLQGAPPVLVRDSDGVITEDSYEKWLEWQRRHQNDDEEDVTNAYSMGHSGRCSDDHWYSDDHSEDYDDRSEDYDDFDDHNDDEQFDMYGDMYGDESVDSY